MLRCRCWWGCLPRFHSGTSPTYRSCPLVWANVSDDLVCFVAAFPLLSISSISASHPCQRLRQSLGYNPPPLALCYLHRSFLLQLHNTIPSASTVERRRNQSAARDRNKDRDQHGVFPGQSCPQGREFNLADWYVTCTSDRISPDHDQILASWQTPTTGSQASGPSTKSST